MNPTHCQEPGPRMETTLGDTLPSFFHYNLAVATEARQRRLSQGKISETYP